MEDFYNIYGVKNDDQISKLLEILEEAEIEFEFFDFRDHSVTPEQLQKWAEFEGVEYPINERSSFYKKNKKKFSKLSNIQKEIWLSTNYIALTRPIIENESGEVLSIGGRPEKLAQKVFGLVKEHQ